MLAMYCPRWWGRCIEVGRAMRRWNSLSSMPAPRACRPRSKRHRLTLLPRPEHPETRTSRLNRSRSDDHISSDLESYSSFGKNVMILDNDCLLKFRSNEGNEASKCSHS